MFENLQATDEFSGESFLQNKCIPNLTLSYPFQTGNEITNQGKYLRARSNSALLCSLTINILGSTKKKLKGCTLQ
jgi:hypothetical protein